jgi:hypothetical protein
MRKFAIAASMLVATLSLLLPTAPAQAQASRTWVSGVGDDANPCSRTAPCKTFAGAISKTAPGGEIDCLDPGGFGALTITKAITIDCTGTFGSVLVSGTNGINVQATQGVDVVILRGIRFNGIGSGINGINFLSGKQLNVERCDIFGFTTNGLNVALGGTAAVLVRNTTFTNITGAGVKATTTSGFAIVEVSDSSFTRATTGVQSDSNAFISVTNSVFHQLTNFGALASNTAASTGGTLNVANSLFTSNGTGINANPGTTVRATNNRLFDNTNAIGGTYTTGGDNKIAGPNGGIVGSSLTTQ